MSHAVERLRGGGAAGLVLALLLLGASQGQAAMATLSLTTASPEPVGSVTVRVIYDGAKVTPTPVDPKQPALGLSVASLHPEAEPQSTLVGAAPVIGGLTSLRVVALSGTEQGIEPPLELLSLAFEATGAESDTGDINAWVESASDRFGNPLKSLPSAEIHFVPEPASALLCAVSLAALAGLGALRTATGGPPRNRGRSASLR